jgi:hypothetical protein
MTVLSRCVPGVTDENHENKIRIADKTANIVTRCHLDPCNRYNYITDIDHDTLSIWKKVSWSKLLIPD